MKTRVTLLATLACALVFGIVGALLTAEVGRRERATLDRELRATVTRLQAPAQRVRTAQLDRLAGDASVRVLRRGEFVYDNGRADGLPVPKPGLSTVTATDGSEWRTLRRNRLLVARPLAVVEDRIGSLQRTIVLASVLGLIACALAVWLVTARALRPLARLRASAASVSTTRDLTLRLEPTGPAEIDEVTGALNAMLARLEGSVAATERFTADAGHELRTPLTSIRANLASLTHAEGSDPQHHVGSDPQRVGSDPQRVGSDPQRVGSDPQRVGSDPQRGLGAAERARVLAELERDVARLSALLDALQALARGDGGAVAREPVDVGELADAALADARRRHPAIVFEFGEAGELTVVGDESGLRSAVDNLLENAARHGASRVRIGVGEDRVTVDDDGPGIAPGERERVFERFARGPRGGSGLGLAIVAQQAALHGGRASVEDSPLGGARVVVTMRA